MADRQGPSARRRWALFLATLLPLGGLLALLAWAAVAQDGSPGGLITNTESAPAAVRQGPAPAFHLEPLGGGPPLELASLAGSVVMLDFWSSWCAPCRAEAPVLAQVYREYAGEQVEFVGIAIWDSAGDVARHIRRYGLDYPNAIDARGTVAVDYGVRGIPEKYFLSPEGEVIAKYVGPTTAEVLRSILDQILAQSVP